MEKLLVICGPTATGKTGLALRLAKKFNGEVVSADSRQVYKLMNIGTGKDLPSGASPSRGLFSLAPSYEIEGVKVWGYDIISPGKDFSVAQYVKFARKIIRNILSRRKLPILTGGTGLYIDGVIDGIETISVPKNKELRERLEERSAEDLFEQLAQIDPIKAASMNTSDKKNPRRLIRAIEIVQWGIKGKKMKKIESFKKDSLFIGVKVEKKKLEEYIDKRVMDRVRAGIEDEIKKLMKKKIAWDDQSMNTLGYKEWQGYFEGKKKKEEVIRDWELDEKRYAKRQMTWFNKNKRIKWFRKDAKSYPANIEKLVAKWYKN